MGDSITYDTLLIVALGLGFAGASFAVALPVLTIVVLYSINLQIFLTGWQAYYQYIYMHVITR